MLNGAVLLLLLYQLYKIPRFLFFINCYHIFNSNEYFGLLYASLAITSYIILLICTMAFCGLFVSISMTQFVNGYCRIIIYLFDIVFFYFNSFIYLYILIFVAATCIFICLQQLFSAPW